MYILWLLCSKWQWNMFHIDSALPVNFSHLWLERHLLSEMVVHVRMDQKRFFPFREGEANHIRESGPRRRHQDAQGSPVGQDNQQSRRAVPLPGAPRSQLGRLPAAHPHAHLLQRDTRVTTVFVLICKIVFVAVYHKVLVPICSRIYRFDIKSNGFYSALPFLANSFVCLFGGK